MIFFSPDCGSVRTVPTRLDCWPCYILLHTPLSNSTLLTSPRIYPTRLLYRKHAAGIATAKRRRSCFLPPRRATDRSVNPNPFLRSSSWHPVAYVALIACNTHTLRSPHATTLLFYFSTHITPRNPNYQPSPPSPPSLPPSHERDGFFSHTASAELRSQQLLVAHRHFVPWRQLVFAHRQLDSCRHAASTSLLAARPPQRPSDDIYREWIFFCKPLRTLSCLRAIGGRLLLTGAWVCS